MAEDPLENPSPNDDVIPPSQADQQQQPQNGNGVQPEVISDRVQKAREMIPVGDRGVTPQTYAQWIDVAKDVCRAYLMLPQHLHNNASVVAGLLEIAARFNLSPYLLASQTYIQNNRLCFQAQAFGAILYASKLLIGRLRFEFRGEGDDMLCMVSGRFKDDPDVIHSATTPPLKLLHPGYSKKEGKESMVRGSPLWDKDPEQQLAYFAERRWIRRHAPDACMGMYTKEEIAEIDDYRIERHGGIPLSADRLGQLDTGEGWGDGSHLEMDLAALQPERPEEQPEDNPEPENPDPPKGRKPAPQPARKAAHGRKPIARAKAVSPPKGRPAKPGGPSRAVVAAVVSRAQHAPPKRGAPIPKWLDYVTDAEAWIKGLTAEKVEKAEAAWDKERDYRDKVQLPVGERSRLRAMLDRKLAQLRPKEAQA